MLSGEIKQYKSIKSKIKLLESSKVSFNEYTYYLERSNVIPAYLFIILFSMFAAYKFLASNILFVSICFFILIFLVFYGNLRIKSYLMSIENKNRIIKAAIEKEETNLFLLRKEMLKSNEILSGSYKSNLNEEEVGFIQNNILE